jgi:hypothetical protein
MIDDIINKAIESDNHDKIMSMFNSGIVPVKVMLMNGNTETRWCNTKDMNITYYEDLDSTQQELLQQTYKDMDYDKVIENHDNKVEAWELKEGCHISQWLKK